MFVVCLIWGLATAKGVEFLVLFSSCSRSLALKLSVESHQMTIFLFKTGV